MTFKGRRPMRHRVSPCKKILVLYAISIAVPYPIRLMSWTCARPSQEPELTQLMHNQPHEPSNAAPSPSIPELVGHRGTIKSRGITTRVVFLF
ncbi:hypothetical protein BDN67DRAFT_967922 [Paxillus ammoniavirescens]|nr:hypothetical protein BDN67DRAFT_967922 [Paxillus ammoniavirescens]